MTGLLFWRVLALVGACMIAGGTLRVIAAQHPPAERGGCLAVWLGFIALMAGAFGMAGWL